MNPHGNHKQKSLIATQKIKGNRVPLQKKKNHKITEKENKRGRKKQLLKRNQKTIK